MSNRGYNIFIRQHPEAARACGSADRPDRRPIDPIVIVQLQHDGHTEMFADSCSATFFCFATIREYNPNSSLVSEHSTIQPPMSSNLLTGTLISSVFYLKDPERNGQIAAFFVFSDLNVRSEGTYKLRFDLFGMESTVVHPLSHCVTQPFTVYSAKRFPGMMNSTELSKSFADQGLKVRIRKDIRSRKRSRTDSAAQYPSSSQGSSRYHGPQHTIYRSPNTSILTTENRMLRHSHQAHQYGTSEFVANAPNDYRVLDTPQFPSIQQTASDRYDDRSYYYTNPHLSRFQDRLVYMEQQNPSQPSTINYRPEDPPHQAQFSSGLSGVTPATTLPSFEETFSTLHESNVTQGHSIQHQSYLQNGSQYRGV